MSGRKHKDAGPTVFGWDEEPAEERPSQWERTSQLDVASGYYRGGSVQPTRRAPPRSGWRWLVSVVFLVALAGGVWAALRWLVPLLHR